MIFCILAFNHNFLEIKNSDGKQTLDTNGNFKAQSDEHANFPEQDNQNMKSEVCLIKYLHYILGNSYLTSIDVIQKFE